MRARVCDRQLLIWAVKDFCMGTSLTEKEICKVSFDKLVLMNRAAILFVLILLFSVLMLSGFTYIGEKIGFFPNQRTKEIWEAIFDTNTLILNLLFVSSSYLLCLLCKIWRVNWPSIFNTFEALVPDFIGFIYFIFLMLIIVSPTVRLIYGMQITSSQLKINIIQFVVATSSYNIIFFACIFSLLKDEISLANNHKNKIRFSIFVLILYFLALFFLSKYGFSFKPNL